MAAMARELRARGHAVAREVTVRVIYKGDGIASHRIDILVDGRVVVEFKAGNHLAPTARLQLLNYLRCSSLELGLLFVFGVRPEFRRLIHTRDRKRDSSDPLAFPSIP